jgi:large subunit ribosomal protein L7/L12
VVPSAGAASPAAAAPAADAEVEDKPREKTIFTLKLINFDAGKKVALIKEIKALMEGMNLVQAKKFVESVPQTLKQDIPKEEAQALKAALEAAGGVLEME